MRAAVAAVSADERESLPRTVRDLLSLTKPRVTALVVFTSLGGMLCAGISDLWLAVTVAASTAALAGAASAANCVIERDADARMARTRNRALPSGRLSPGAAVAFSAALAAAGLAVLLVVSNPVTAALGAFAFASYVFVYTPLKRHGAVALYVGAVPGALPPLMGTSAVSGGVDAIGLVLFAVLFLWQIPHFAAIAVRYRGDYAQAGFRVIAVERGPVAAIRAGLGASLVLVPVTLLLVPIGAAGLFYGAVALFLGAGLAAGCLATLRAGATARASRRLFHATNAYLVLLVLTLAADRVLG